MTITVVGAKGGVGVTSVALSIASRNDGTYSSDDPVNVDDAKAIFGVASGADLPHGDAVSVIDAGTLDRFAATPHDGRRVLVVRNCYLSLRRAIAMAYLFDVAVVITEPDRALDAQDVASVLGLPIIELPYDTAVARAIDSGLFNVRRPESLRRLDGLMVAV